MPFRMHLSAPATKKTLGIADGQHAIPDDIDECNGVIAELFGVKS